MCHSPQSRRHWPKTWLAPLALLAFALPAHAQVEPPAAATHVDAPLTLEDISVDIRINLEARDGALSVLMIYTFRTLHAGSVRFTADDPLQLPTLVPAVRDVVLDRGVFPTAARHIQIKTTGDATVERSGDSLALVGEIAAGRPLDLRIAYPMATPEQRVTLGLRGVVGLTSVAMAAYGTTPVRLRLHSARTARVATYQEGQERYAALSLTRPLRYGEVAIFEVSDLASPAAWPGRTLAGLFVVAALISAAVLLRRREDDDGTEAS